MGDHARYLSRSRHNLLRRQRRWLLLPPAAATWSLRPALAQYAAARSDPEAQAIEVVQRAGDLLVVPAGWTHLTLNVARGLTVSVSTEFHLAGDLAGFQRVREAWQAAAAQGVESQ